MFMGEKQVSNTLINAFFLTKETWIYNLYPPSFQLGDQLTICFSVELRFRKSKLTDPKIPEVSEKSKKINIVFG